MVSNKFYCFCINVLQNKTVVSIGILITLSSPVKNHIQLMLVVEMKLLEDFVITDIFAAIETVRFTLYLFSFEPKMLYIRT